MRVRRYYRLPIAGSGNVIAQVKRCRRDPLLNIRRWYEGNRNNKAFVMTDNWGKFYIQSFYFRDPKKSYDIIVHNP